MFREKEDILWVTCLRYLNVNVQICQYVHPHITHTQQNCSLRIHEPARLLDTGINSIWLMCTERIIIVKSILGLSVWSR